MSVSFYLLNRSDDVDVYIVNSDGSIVATLASGATCGVGCARPDGRSSWDGRLAGGAVAPDGAYYIKVALIHQGRSVPISNNTGPEPVTVETVPPRPRVTRVSPSLIPQPGGAGAIDPVHRQRRPQRPDPDLPHRPARPAASGQELRLAGGRGIEMGRDDQRAPGASGHLSGRLQGHRQGVQHGPVPA